MNNKHYKYSNMDEWTLFLFDNTAENLKKWIGKPIRGKIYTTEDVAKDAHRFTTKTLTFIKTMKELGLIDPTNIDNVCENIFNSTHQIDYLSENERNIFGIAEKEQKRIRLNPNMGMNVSDNQEVNEKQNDYMLDLYLFHELAHKCLPKIDNTFDSIPTLMKFKNSSTVYGYQALEEAVAQEIAEMCYYKHKNLERPAKTKHTDTILPKVVFKSNFNYYGLYQPVAVSFGRALRGVGKSSDDSSEKIMYDLCHRATHNNLLTSIVEEYKHDGLETECFQLFHTLAHIYSAKQNSFGVHSGLKNQSLNPNTNEFEPSLEEELGVNVDVKKLYMWVIDKLNSLEDYRPLLPQSAPQQ